MKKQKSKLSKFKIAALVGSIGTLIATAPALVATGTAYLYSLGGQTLTVNATVQNTCTINSSPVLNFGQYVPNQGTNLDVSTTFTVTCTGGLWTVGLDNGSNFSSGRRMISGGNFLPYSLSGINAGGANWGNTAGTDTYASGSASSTGNGSPQTLTVYGRIASGQTIPVGSYSDTVQITLYYN